MVSLEKEKETVKTFLSNTEKIPDEFEIQLNLIPKEVLSRISSAIDHGGYFSIRAIFGRKGFVGKVENGRFWIAKKRIYGNMFAPFFYGSVEMSPVGSWIRARFRMHPLSKILMVIWFVLLGLFGAIAISTAVLSFFLNKTESIMGNSPWVTLLFIVVPVILFLAGITILRFGKMLGRMDKKAILELLNNLFRDSVSVK